MNTNQDWLNEVDKILDQYETLHDQIEAIWMNHMVFTWHWWADLALATLPWILWFIVRDRKNTHNLLYAGFFTIIAATLLDMIGISQGSWQYNTLLLPYFPEYLPWDITVMPVMSMLFYQYFPRVNPWLKGAIFGLVGAYVAEPIFILFGFYEPGGWEHHYSLPIYFTIYMIGYWFYRRSLMTHVTKRD